MVFLAKEDLQGLESYTESNSLESVDQLEAAFGETMAAGYRQLANEELSVSEYNAFRPHFEKRHAQLVAAGANPSLAELYLIEAPSKIARVAEIIANQGPGQAKRRTGQPQLVDAILQQQAFETLDPEIPTDAFIRETVVAELAVERDRNQRILARGGAVPAFVGAAGAIMTKDPLVIASLPFGAQAQVGRGVLVNALRGGAIEGAVAGAVEIPIQAEVARFKAEIEAPWEFKDSAYNVLAATFGAGVLRATGSVTIDVAQEAVAKYRNWKGPKTPESDAAAETLERYARMESERPDNIDFAGVDQEAANQARLQLERGDNVDVSEIVERSETLNEVDQVTRFTNENFVVLEPGEIQVDARRFQFKEAGLADPEGVSDALRGETRFDPAKAAGILTWQDKAGNIFIVDGHQRVGIANRALAGGQNPQEVMLSGFMLREADGITDIDAMRIGAVKNLTASTGSALDAAKVLRGIGPAGEAMLPPLPPNGAVLRQGRFISRLGDESFNATVNGVIPERQAAVVGELIHGDAEQLATIQALSRAQPANETEARAMVEQIRAAGFRVTETEDLFGTQEIAETLLKERAQVVDATLKAARQDRATFSRLVSRGTDIEDVGANRLDVEANQQKVNDSGQAIEILTRLANTKGPVSDAIDEAARQVKAGASPSELAESILAAAGRATDGGDTGGRAADGPGTLRTADQLRDFISQQPEDIEALIALAPRAQEELVATLHDAVDELGLEVLDPGAKKPAGVREKMERKHYQSAQQLTDVARATVVVADQGDDVIERLVAAGVDILDEGWSPKGLGYFDRKVLIRTETGVVAETVIIGKNMHAAKAGRGHELYEQLRDMEKRGEFGEQFDQLEAESVQFYAAAAGKDGLSGNAFSKSGLLKGMPESRISTTETGVQSPPSSSTAIPRTEPELRSTAAGRASQSNKSTDIAAPPDESISGKTPGGNDKITAPPLEKGGYPDEGARTGYVSDADYESVLAEFQALDEEALGLIEVSRVGIDERGETTTEILTARQVMDDLDANEQALQDIEVCST